MPNYSKYVQKRAQISGKVLCEIHPRTGWFPVSLDSSEDTYPNHFSLFLFEPNN
jgi:hypothetical protein